MAKKLVIVESPAKAKTINKFLGKDYQVEACFGHVRDLPKSKMGVDFETSFTPRYVIPTKARKVVNHLKKAARGKEVFLAPDPDREGEAISWHLTAILDKNPKAIHRVEFNEITKEAVKKAFEHPRVINEKLVNAQQARRILDRIVGYELSPLLWKKVSRGLSAGRVQSVALRLVVEREDEIKKFIPEEYWSLCVKLSSHRASEKEKVFVAKLDRIGKDRAELKSEEETLKIKATLEKGTFQVGSVDKKERARRPQAPYTTSKLQQEAYNRLGFPAAKTMRVAQMLYEGVDIGDESVGLITYMRTDSVQVAKSALGEVTQFIQQTFGKEYLPGTPNVYKSKKSAQEAHEAIRPTSAFRTPESIKAHLSHDEFKLYELIWSKFVASQMSEARDLVTSVEIVAEKDYFFKASGTINLFPGFSKVFLDAKAHRKRREKAEGIGEQTEERGEEDDEQPLPDLVESELLKLHELIGDQHFTKPPARYNDASLVKALEEDGIGRPSTYAPTIHTLLAREYVHRKGGALMPSELGEIVMRQLLEHFPKIMDIQFTALMEEELDKIEEGELDWVRVLKDFYEPFQKSVADAKLQMKDVKQEITETGQVCEKCGKPMVIRWGRFGKFIACSGFPECKNTKPISTGVACPQPGCNGSLIKRKSKRGRPFYGCSNYPTCTYISNQLPKTETETKEAADQAPTPTVEEKH
ncbi:MAG: type I DNA topoisomerase [Candidatus Omnitrophica bacterium]|nr:type I DNA topoisomerase [Candidatus Omnitrophota bacterium]